MNEEKAQRHFYNYSDCKMSPYLPTQDPPKPVVKAFYNIKRA